MTMNKASSIIWILLLLGSMAQGQLKLGSNPSSINKSSVLELESNVQGLLLPRIPDTTVTTLATAPNGMIIFFTPDNSLMIRKNGFWRKVADTANFSSLLVTSGWALGGNPVSSAQHFGTTSNFDLPVITNNLERLRITNAGNVGIGTNAPSTHLHIKTGTANDGGLRMENLTSASTVTSNTAVLGVDANGKVVLAKRPVFYSGGSGGTATIDDVTKIWVADILYNPVSGTQTIAFPTNFTFTTVLNIQVTAKGGSGVDNAPIATVVSNTTSNVIIRVVESDVPVLTNSLIVHTSIPANPTRIFIRVEGN